MLLASSALAFDLRIEGQRVSLHAVDEPLQNILRSMALHGIRVRLDPQVNPRVSSAFIDREFEEVIASIVKPFDYALVWEKAPQQSSSLRLSEIQVFRPGNREMIQDLRPRSYSIARDPRDGALFAKDQFLLRVKSGADLDAYLKIVGGFVIGKNDSLGIYQIGVPPGSDIPAIVARINALPGEVQAAPDFAYAVPPFYRSDMHLPAGEIAKTFRADGKVPVAVLDSGLAAGTGPDGFVIASLDAVNPGQPISDHVGHGTQMALVASGLVRPFGAETAEGGQVPVVAIRAMDDNGYATDSSILKSVQFALEKGAKVMSLSWGSEKRSVFLEIILDDAASRGMIIVASAGNEPTGKPVYPAAYPSVLGVGAAYPGGKTWEQSNYGSFVDVYAPGFAVFPVGNKGAPGMYGGTSISAAYTANRIADYWSKHPTSTVQQIMDAVKATNSPQ